jgi:hypothetical protein
MSVNETGGLLVFAILYGSIFKVVRFTALDIYQAFITRSGSIMKGDTFYLSVKAASI